ncbi:DUF397 domain-containing protein [Solwaraspora sp. WMMD1047]|uniref:DUF397 domain-containing protein n=1 Tax=Solwaraspora sp. WMMD1047 TaxID=3016102 RepID=UPI00241597CE|nr:DUF397 domain-containing protein [Solwaraspora sp. WMMD1047]MDG4828934.1 DUF397 domain-containing protein [Solwaraspora sp. WMMD1047]
MSPTDSTAITWRRSGRCESQHCVEVARVDDDVAIRDSTDPAHHLRFDRAGWRAFVATLRADLPEVR